MKAKTAGVVFWHETVVQNPWLQEIPVLFFPWSGTQKGAVFDAFLAEPPSQISHPIGLEHKTLSNDA